MIQTEEVLLERKAVDVLLLFSEEALWAELGGIMNVLCDNTVLLREQFGIRPIFGNYLLERAWVVACL